jgi:hydrogenase maturation protease
VTAGVLVIAIGNPSRGDDALGPLLADRLEAWLRSGALAGVEVLTDMQLQPEHALDLAGRRRVLIVDAALSGEAPYHHAHVEPAPPWSFTTHAVLPEALAGMARALGQGDPPPIELLAVRGYAFELGQPLSDAASRHAEAAWRFLQHWCRDAVQEAIFPVLDPSWTPQGDPRPVHRTPQAQP